MLRVCRDCLPKGFPSISYYAPDVASKCGVCDRLRPSGMLRVVEADTVADFRFEIWKRTFERGVGT